MSKRCRTASSLGKASTIAALPPEILEHIFSFVEQQIRKSVLVLVCKSWNKREAAVPQRPNTIEYKSGNPKSRAAFSWLIARKFETSRLQKVYICTYSDTPNQDTESINKLLTMLAGKPSPLTSMRLEYCATKFQSHSSLVSTLASLRKLESLTITSWRYGAHDVPSFIELSNLQSLQELRLFGVRGKSGLPVNDTGKTYGGLRQALQSLTALKRLVLFRAEPAGWLFESPGVFWPQLRRSMQEWWHRSDEFRCCRQLTYQPEPGLASCMEGAAHCLSNMPYLRNLTIGCASTILEQTLPSLHALEDLRLDRVVDFPVVLSGVARVTSISFIQGFQAVTLDDVLPSTALRHLLRLHFAAGFIGGNDLPDCWSQLSSLIFLSLPRCSFLPVGLASLPRLRFLAMQTYLGQDPLGAAGAESLRHLIESIPQVLAFQIAFHTTCKAQADAFRAEISRVQQLVPDKTVRGSF